MSCCKNQPSNPGKFPVGVLGCGPIRTEYDMKQIIQTDTSKIPDTLLSVGKKEGYCPCNGQAKARAYRSLTWDDTDNLESYNIRAST